MNGNSLDISQQKIIQLKALLPEIFAEDKIDLQRLAQILGKDHCIYADMKEQPTRYELSWAGKDDARREIQRTTTNTLVPTTYPPTQFEKATGQLPHCLVEGENLTVLRILQKSYFGKIKMVYIDPPYNTGNDSFIYPDNFAETSTQYLQRTGILSNDNQEATLNRQTLWRKNLRENGQFHSVWLSMMYPRLYLARNLLRDDGMIFISIDDNEAANLKLLCDEILGAENAIGDFVWRKKVGAGADAKLFFRQHEHILLYAKNINAINALYQPLTDAQKREYANPDQDPRGDWAATDLSSPAHDNDPKRIYEVMSPTGKLFKKCWSYTQANFEQLIAQNLIWWGKEGNSMPKRKRFLSEKKGLTPRSWIDSVLTQDGRKDLAALGMNNFFDYPKPVQLIKHFLSIATQPYENDLILDFFAGSGTTAQAVLELNAEDDGNRRFIVVQMPEPTDANSQAYQAGYPTIANITQARIQAVIAKIAANKAKNNTTADIQLNTTILASFVLAPSNFKQWRGDLTDQQDIKAQLFDLQQSEKTDSLHHNMFNELCLKMGFGLGINYTILSIGSSTVYEIPPNPDAKDQHPPLWICFEPYNDLIKEAILARKPQQIVMLNTCFRHDAELASFRAELKHHQLRLSLI